MKVTVVPAQITTVEDRIAGNLSMSQLLLCICPVFVDSILYVIVPPNFHNAGYKLFIMVCVLVISVGLAARIKGKLVLFWAMILARYYLRPGLYVYDKNSLSHRDYQDIERFKPVVELEELETVPLRKRPTSLSPTDIIQALEIIESQGAALLFNSGKKGGLRVLVSKVKD